jgi:hypothetical protein
MSVLVVFKKTVDDVLTQIPKVDDIQKRSDNRKEIDGRRESLRNTLQSILGTNLLQLVVSKDRVYIDYLREIATKALEIIPDSTTYIDRSDLVETFYDFEQWYWHLPVDKTEPTNRIKRFMKP